ncbi:DnaJ domain-containing protein [Paraburkholderia sp. RL18-103-BIB-C]|uniref:DnaJ domain-containing protein n=1 Tax=Paraburkholderia sp. RL18-103-BIB-C TaxID=3031637 RepID=UPI0038B9B057
MRIGKNRDSDGSLYEASWVSESASPEELRAAYRRAAVRWHPDRSLGNTEYAENASNSPSSHVNLYGSFKSAVGNAAHEACGLSAEKSSLPAMRNSTVRMVLKLAYPRALRLAA